MRGTESVLLDRFPTVLGDPPVKNEIMESDQMIPGDMWSLPSPAKMDYESDLYYEKSEFTETPALHAKPAKKPRNLEDRVREYTGYMQVSTYSTVQYSTVQYSTVQYSTV